MEGIINKEALINLLKNAKEKVKSMDKKQIVIVAIVCLIIIVIIASVSSFGVSEERIKKEIMYYEGFNETVNPLEITEYIEYRRDTDRADKYDNIWVAIVVENAFVKYKVSYCLSFGLYNGEWVLNSIYKTNDYLGYEGNIYALNSIEEDLIKKELLLYFKNTIDYYSLENIEMDIKIPAFDESELDNVKIECKAQAENDDMTCAATIETYWSMDYDYGWLLTSASVIEKSYTAKNTPSETLIDKVLLKYEGKSSLKSTKSTNSNECTLIYSRVDEGSCKNLKITWEDTLTFKFNPDEGGWYLFNSSSNPSSVLPNLTGTWKYQYSSDYIILNVKSVDSNMIKYDVDFQITPTNILAVSNKPHTASEKNLKRNWNYEYDSEEKCIVFTADEPLFTVTYGVDLWTDEYELYYKAYVGEEFGVSGFYVNNRLLSLVEK